MRMPLGLECHGHCVFACLPVELSVRLFGTSNEVRVKCLPDTAMSTQLESTRTLGPKMMGFFFFNRLAHKWPKMEDEKKVRTYTTYIAWQTRFAHTMVNHRETCTENRKRTTHKTCVSDKITSSVHRLCGTCVCVCVLFVRLRNGSGCGTCSAHLTNNSRMQFMI